VERRQVSERWRFAALAGAVLAGALGMAGDVMTQTRGNVGSPSASQLKNPVAATPASIAAGKQAYDANCAACHGGRGQGAVKAGITIPSTGGKQPPDLTDDQWDHGSSDGDLFAVTKRGLPQTLMTGFDGRIPDADIWNLVNYLRTLKGRTPPAPAPAPVVPDRQAASPLDQLVVPQGFDVSSFAENVENAREMALGPQGTIFVGSLRAGKVHAVVDRDGDHRADRVVVIASGLDQPNGVAIRNGALYVATASRILRFDDIERHLDAPPAPVIVREDLPNPKTGHSWKFLALGPDDLLYFSVGAPCNICESPPLVSTILRMKPDGSNLEVFAEGVRNSVGFDWHPATREMWFTDNGRDMLGDDVPNDELNVAWKPGLHFGFPFCHQGDVPDPQFGAQRACSTTEPPVQKLGPHVAALGLSFYTGAMFPASYRNAVIVAQHGSWNRTVPIGYRVMVARTDGRRVTSYESLVDGFLPGVRANAPTGRGAAAAAIGRPVDVLQMPDGSILISDDSGNRLIRVSYSR
jgi:glucose/arabinose dehydrogenase